MDSSNGFHILSFSCNVHLLLQAVEGIRQSLSVLSANVATLQADMVTMKANMVTKAELVTMKATLQADMGTMKANMVTKMDMGLLVEALARPELAKKRGEAYAQSTLMRSLVDVVGRLPDAFFLTGPEERQV